MNYTDLTAYRKSNPFMDFCGIEAVRAEHDDADAALLEVQRHAERAVLEAEQLVGLAFIQPVHLGDAVADLNDVADLILLRLGCIIFDLILDDLTDIVDSEIHGFTNLIF